MKTKSKRLLLVLSSAALVVPAVVVLAKAHCDAHYYDGYDVAAPLNIALRQSLEHPGYTRTDFTFDGLPGRPVPAALALPETSAPPWPCILFLHGIGQDKEFLDEIAPPFVAAGFAVATFDQFMRGERRLKEANVLEEVLAFRHRAAFTVIESRRLIDYLATRADIDMRRIYICGASYGAITGCNVAAFDKRVAAAAITYGGGDLPRLLASEEAAKLLAFWLRPAVYAAAWFLAPADPVKHVADIAPRPVLFQNGRHDALIPPAAAQALFDAAGEPKAMTWYDSNHIGLDREHTERVVNDAIAWLLQQDRLILSNSIDAEQQEGTEE